MITVAKQSNESREPVGRREVVLRTLRDAPGPLSIADIADRLGVHPNTVRFHLETLVGRGQVERIAADRRTPGRPPQLFRVARGMDPTGPRHYRLLAEVLADTIATGQDPSSRAVEAGRAWGRHQVSSSGDGGASGTGDSVDRLITLLDGLGFAPERREDDDQAQIGLRHCPFLELAANRSEIVCPVHLGLMQGAMDAWHSTITVDRLDAFVEPDLCLAHLTGAGAS
ncbi:MAG TPA: helix-turn-helix domain-containing protein [Kribbellaceae bacterium]|nr:helix-turn-helix domain-containing protein [Kribbellaceae bacterium]